VYFTETCEKANWGLEYSVHRIDDDLCMLSYGTTGSCNDPVYPFDLSFAQNSSIGVFLGNEELFQGIVTAQPSEEFQGSGKLSISSPLTEIDCADLCNLQINGVINQAFGLPPILHNIAVDIDPGKSKMPF